MQKFGCPERLTQMIRHLQNGTSVRVTNNGAVPDAFVSVSGVKLGCVSAPALFSLMLSVMLLDAYREERPGTCVAQGQTASLSANDGRTPSRLYPQLSSVKLS
ncbi:hypothetical protein SprV_0702295400 [Sparganum proliferum]